MSPGIIVLTIMIILLTLTALAGDGNSVPQPPAAKKVPHLTKVHGETLVDNYFWLRDKANPEVRAYLEAENAYAGAVMAPTREFQEALYREILSHIKETDVRVPYLEGGYFYYSRTEEGRQYPIHCRKRGTLDGPEEIILDQNELAKGEKFMSVGVKEISGDGNLLAYSTDSTGFRQYRLQVKDLRTSKVFPERIEKTGSVAWASDSQTLFYTVEDAAKRQYRLYRHLLGKDPSSDVLIYEEKDERFEIEVERSRSHEYLFLLSSSLTTSEVRYLDVDQSDGPWELIAPRIQDQKYYADHHNDLFYIRTNRQNRNFEVVVAPVNSPDRNHWKALVGPRSDVMLEGLELFAGHMVLRERQNGLQHILVRDLRNGLENRVSFPDASYTVFPGDNREWSATKFRYHYYSPITPESVYDYDMEKGESKLLKQQEVPGGFEQNNYHLERIYSTGRDGVRVPITVAYRRDVKHDGKAPLYLYAYGSYGLPLPVTFAPTRLPLLDRGVVVALAHVRGGGDMGKAWHDEGRMMKKMNTFTDFVSTAEHLIAEKYCARDKIAIEGSSAGGLLMGAVTNMRPDLWRIVLSHVPFVDVINTMLDASLPLTVPEYEEWGNPDKKEDYEYIKQYSPYDNLQAKAYPAMLVTTSFNDSQVMYWEPAKYVAKLRTFKRDKNVLLLKTNMAAGHGGGSGRYDRLREVAFEYAFLLSQLGITR